MHQVFQVVCRTRRAARQRSVRLHLGPSQARGKAASHGQGCSSPYSPSALPSLELSLEPSLEPVAGAGKVESIDTELIGHRSHSSLLMLVCLHLSDWHGRGPDWKPPSQRAERSLAPKLRGSSEEDDNNSCGCDAVRRRTGRGSARTGASRWAARGESNPN